MQDKAHFTNSEQKVQSEVVFGEAGEPASAIRPGDRCLTVLYPHDPADRFDHEYYRDHHMTSAATNHQRVVDDVPHFTSVSPVSFMTEVVGAFDA